MIGFRKDMASPLSGMAALFFIFLTFVTATRLCAMEAETRGARERQPEAAAAAFDLMCAELELELIDADESRERWDISARELRARNELLRYLSRIREGRPATCLSVGPIAAIAPARTKSGPPFSQYKGLYCYGTDGFGDSW